MDQIAALVIIVILMAVSLIAFFIVLNLFFSPRVAKTRLVIENSLGRSFLVGIVNFVFLMGIALVLFSLGDSTGQNWLSLLGLLVLLPLALGLVFGLAGVVQFVGNKLAPQATELMRTVWGTLAVSLACALPFVGWFGLLTLVGSLGLGACVLSFFYREQPLPVSE